MLVLVFFTLNFSAAQDVDNSTTLNMAPDSQNNHISQSADDNPILSDDVKLNTEIDVKSSTEFDCRGDAFEVQLTDENKTPISNVKVSFAVAGATYTKNTDNNGFASLPIRLNDGIYKITIKFAGNKNYNPSSNTTTISVNNVKEIGEGLSNAEIQHIIDSAKEGNVILFNGKNYDDVNLVITKKLTLITKSATSLKSTSSSPVITIKGKDASLTSVTGFNIQGKGDGIRVTDSDYVIIKNNVISNSANAIVAVGADYLNITNNKLNNNAGDAVLLAKSTHVYIYKNDILNNKNGIELNNVVNGVKYSSGPENVYIVGNDISKNNDAGILVKNAGDNININLNTIDSNKYHGIAIGAIGDNKIQSNVITNSRYGIIFIDQYTQPKNQDISYNAIFGHVNKEIEARDTFYTDTSNRLVIGDNWYTDYNTLCPKIKTNNLKFVVKPIGNGQYQAVFLDSNNNVASLLPDRELTYTTSDGQTVSFVVKGGAAVFSVDDNVMGRIKATVDDSDRFNNRDSEESTVSEPINGKTPTYDYPNIDYSQFDDGGMGAGDGDGSGDGNGQGSNGNSNNGGSSSSKNSEFTANSTSAQQSSPSSKSSSPINQASQSPEAFETTSQSSVSKSESGGSASSQPQSVVKQISLTEKDIYKITGILFIILLFIFTIGFYYRDDIAELKSKM